MKACINAPDLIIKIATIPIYGKKKKKKKKKRKEKKEQKQKNLQSILLQNQSPIILKLEMQNWEHKLYKVYINDDPALSLTLKYLKFYILYINNDFQLPWPISY